MNRRTLRIHGIGLAFLGLCIFSAPARPAESATASASRAVPTARIPRIAHARRGLIVQVEFGDGELLKRLGASPGVVVQGLARDADADQRGMLYVLSTEDGRVLAQQKLAGPVIQDGMAVAAGRVFLVTTKNQIVCLDGN